MSEKAFEHWCREATSLIRFTPDRKAVHDELMAHLQDRRDAFMEQGKDEAAATQAAVDAMGNPWELAAQLAQVHKPFWGYAYKITRIAAIILCSILLLSTVNIGGNMLRFYEEYNDGGQILSAFPPDGSDWEIVMLVHPDQDVYTDGYRLRLADAILWQQGSELRLSFIIQQYHLPTQEPSVFLTNCYAVDNLGTHYEYLGNYAVQGSYFSLRGNSSVHCGKAMHLEIRGIPSTDIQWLELRYERDGRNIAFRIDLTGGDTP